MAKSPDIISDAIDQAIFEWDLHHGNGVKKVNAPHRNPNLTEELDQLNRLHEQEVELAKANAKLICALIFAGK